MEGYRGHLVRLLILSVAIVALVVGHGAILSYILSHMALSAAVAVGALILVVISHFGLFGTLIAMLRRHSRSNMHR